MSGLHEHDAEEVLRGAAAMTSAEAGQVDVGAVTSGRALDGDT
jgi:hypothetical protein